MAIAKLRAIGDPIRPIWRLVTRLLGLGQDAVDFIVARLAAHPGAHVYHYAAYEPTALKRLMMLHGTREVEVDNLLRNKKIVDLFKVLSPDFRANFGACGHGADFS